MAVGSGDWEAGRLTLLEWHSPGWRVVDDAQHWAWAERRWRKGVAAVQWHPWLADTLLVANRDESVSILVLSGGGARAPLPRGSPATQTWFRRPCCGF